MPRLLSWIAVLLVSSAIDAAEIAVYFSPQGGATAAVVDELDGAKKTVRVQAYAFSSPAITQALERAHGRGVDVQLCLDAKATRQRGNLAAQVAAAGLPTYVDRRHQIAHSKVIVIDDRTVITGSFNWSRQAEKNLENLLVIHDRDLARRYAANWAEHRSHCQPVED